MSDAQRLAERMRKDWDARAQDDAMYYIDTRSDAWEREEFFRRGATEAHELVEPVLDRFDFDPAGKRLLEIGCGLGRLFPGFAELFGELWGIDVSPAMIEQAGTLCPVPGARFVVGNGLDLAGIPDESIDYCFSYLVFHHLPEQTVVWRYLDEIRRVLRPGGVCQIQFRGSESAAARIARRWPTVAGRASRVLGSSRVPGGRSTWAGVPVSRREVIDRLHRLGFVQADVYPGGIDDRRPVAYWTVARKP
jgi:SAM-dependent methyltransferase